MFHIPPDPSIGTVSAEIRDLTVRNGTPHANGGGGIFSWGELTLVRSIVTGNAGGGIGARGPLTVLDSNIRENSGGGIVSQGSLAVMRTTISGNVDTGVSASGEVVINDSTINNNTNPGGGGGASLGPGVVTITNSTISGNSAGCYGGGILNQGFQSFTTTTRLINVTLNQNTTACSGQGGNISSSDISSVALTNTIVSNGGVGGDCSGAITSLGHNLDSDSTCGLTGPRDISNVDPLLEPLADNGGPTLTHMIRGGSPAIDTGDNAACPPTDQRGFLRPWDANGDNVVVCDIGAVESHLISGPPPVPCPAGGQTCPPCPAGTAGCAVPTPKLPITLPLTGGTTPPNALPLIAAIALPALALGLVVARRLFTHR